MVHLIQDLQFETIVTLPAGEFLSNCIEHVREQLALPANAIQMYKDKFAKKENEKGQTKKK